MPVDAAKTIGLNERVNKNPKNVAINNLKAT